MATDINTLKSWFETGDKPTQEQFWAWIDSYWHKSEGIPVSAVSGLGNLISGKADSSQLQYYAKTDASNIDVNVWKVKLLPSNIATVDNNDLTGNVYDKSQCDNLFYKRISDPGDSKIYLLGVDGKSVCLNDIICDLVSTCLLPPVDVTDCPNSSVTFTLNPTPSDAIVTLNGVIQKTITVDSGTDVTYKVERDGYFPKTDTINVTENKILAVELPPVLDNTLLQFKVKTTQLNERVPIALLRTSDTEGVSLINYGDGIEQLVTVPIYNGSESWTDSQGETHYVDTGNTFYHDYKNPGEYTITIKTGANIGYIRLCESLTQGVDGYMKPSENKYITEVSKFQSDSLTNLDYTFAGLSNAVLSPDFKLEAPEVTTMNATFYGFGISTEIKSFPAMMLSKITKPTALRGTFFRCGVKQILPSFLDSFADLVSVWELFKNSKLGNGFYSGVDAGQFPNIAVNGTNDFIPVSLFWKNPKLKEISHCFNYIGEGFFGNLTSGYLAYFVIRRELFWNGKEAGNATGTIENAFYAFAKCNRVICEPNLLKHAPNMVHIGGLFTQTNQTMHPVGWATIIPVAASETEIYQFAESGGNYTATPVAGKGLTFDLRVMFPDVSYPNIKTLNGAFTVAATGGNMGFQHPIDYTPNGLPAKLDLSMSGADFLSKFPNAKADSVDASAKIILGQSGGTDQEKSDGRNGVFYMLDQDTRISDKATVPALLFNNAIPY